MVSWKKSSRLFLLQITLQVLNLLICVIQNQSQVQDAHSTSLNLSNPRATRWGPASCTLDGGGLLLRFLTLTQDHGVLKAAVGSP